MNYEELQDKVIRKSGAISKKLENNNFRIPESWEPYGKNASTLLNQEAEDNLNLGAFSFAVQTLEDTELKIRKTKLTGLSGNEVRSIITDIQKKLVARVEKIKSDEIMKTLKSIDALMQRKDHRTHSERLYDLEILKLNSGLMSDSERKLTMSEFRVNQQYSAEQVLLTAGTDDQLKSQAKKLLGEIPPKLSTKEGRKMLDYLQELNDLKTGEFFIKYSGNDKARDRVHVCQLIDKGNLRPSAKDIGITI